MNLKNNENEIRRIAEEKAKKYNLEWEQISQRMLQVRALESTNSVVVTIHTEIHPDLNQSFKFQGELAAEIEGQFENVKVVEFGDWFQLQVPVPVV